MPIAILGADRASDHGWWPSWIAYVWPTNYMFGATSAIVDGFWYEIAALSIGINALIYVLVGLAISALVAKGRS